MPLPLENAPWPPPEWLPGFEQMASNHAWSVGDIDAIQAFAQASAGGSYFRGDDPDTHYNNRPPLPRFGARVLRMIGRTFNLWNRDTPTGQARTRLHAPLAGNIGALSADTLMGEPPVTRILAGGKAVKGPQQARADLVLNSPDVHMALQQGAELAASISGSVLTAHWNPEISRTPWLGVTACDAAVPEYVLGQLYALNLWTTYPEITPAGVVLSVYYHVERHELGRVVHALYRGTEHSIGVRVPLQDHPQTETIPTIPGSVRGEESNTVYLPSGINSLTARYWRNLPTRQFRRDGILSRLGRADIEGAEALLDAVDLTWSSWMRDIKLARARLIIPESMLDVKRAGGGGNFDDDQEIVQALNFVNLKGEDDHIRSEQFGIRFEEHSSTLEALTHEVLQHAGYSISSYGQKGETSGATATEVNDRRTTTEGTRDRKSLYFRGDAGNGIFTALLELDSVHYRRRGALSFDPDWTLDIRFPETTQIDPEKEARVLSGLAAARAASIETLVRMRDPELDDPDVRAEVERIYLENSIGVTEPDPATVDRTDPDADPEEEQKPADDEADRAREEATA